MTAWWNERLPRERALIASVGIVTLVLALAQFFVMPLLQFRASAQDRHEAALAMLAEVEAGARTIGAIRAAMGERAEASARTSIAATAQELGLAITRLQPLENAELDVWLDDVSSPLLFAWIGRLQERGFPVTRAVIQQGEGSTVSAHITFAGGN